MEGIQAARERRNVRRWVNNITPGAVAIVLTNLTVVHNIRPNQAVMVRQLHCHVGTDSDLCLFEIGYTDALGGAGNFTPLGAQRFIRTGVATVGYTGIDDIFDPALIARHSDGARSVTIRVTCNDAAAIITCEWGGWYEVEGV